MGIRGSVVAGTLTGGMVVGAGVLAWTLVTGQFGTRTIDRSAPAVVERINDLADFHAATGRFTVLVDVERDVQRVPSFVAGERTLFIGVGSVDAVVDLGAIGPEDVVVGDGGRSVVVTLPAVRLSPARVDTAASHVAARDRGLIDRLAGLMVDNPTSEQPLYRLTEGKLQDAAEASELRARGEDHAVRVVESLVRTLGFEQVEVRVEGSDRRA